MNVLIAGGGVAGLEAALALRELAGDRVSTTLLSPAAEFVYRPMRVQEPFAGPAAQRFALEEIAHDIGVKLTRDAFKWLEPDRRIVHTEAGAQLHYEALLLALGARVRPRFKHALTLDDSKLDEQLTGLVRDVEAGYVHRIAFIAPGQMPWPLPLYEIALMTARRGYEMNEQLSVTVVTPEQAPLEVFGTVVSDRVAQMLAENRITVVTATHAETPEAGVVLLPPGEGSLTVDRIVALPELFGPSTPGIPKRDGHGFIATDVHCRVPGLDGVFAAGDATDFAVKHGGIASQQADVAAEGIAALAGVAIEPRKFSPEIHGMLLGAGRPVYLSAHFTGSHGSSSVVSERPTWPSGAKIDARYLAPYLAQHAGASTRS